MEERPNSKMGPAGYAGVVLGILGIVKLISLAVDGGVGQTVDPVTGLEYSLLLSITGLVEIGIAACVLLLLREAKSAVLLSLFAMAAITYHVMLAGSETGSTCPCLGVASKWLGIGAGNEAQVTLGMAIWFLLTGGASYIRESAKTDFACSSTS